MPHLYTCILTELSAPRHLYNCIIMKKQENRLLCFSFIHHVHYHLMMCCLTHQWASFLSCFVIISFHFLFFSFLFQCIFVSFPVVLFITGEASSAAFPAHTRRAPLPVQAFLHREHFWRWPQESYSYATTLPQSQVQEVTFCISIQKLNNMQYLLHTKLVH